MDDLERERAARRAVDEALRDAIEERDRYRHHVDGLSEERRDLRRALRRLENATRRWLEFDNEVEPPYDGHTYERWVAYEKQKADITEAVAEALEPMPAPDTAQTALEGIVKAAREYGVNDQVGEAIAHAELVTGMRQPNDDERGNLAKRDLRAEYDSAYTWAVENERANQRLLRAAAAALERCQVATDASGAADEAAAILEQVVTLSGEYVPSPTGESQ